MADDLSPAPATRTILVAGSGAAGLTAALTAARAGARVVLAERTGLLGGTTALSFGRVWIPASHDAPADTPEAARRYLSGLYDDRHPHMIEALIGAGALAIPTAI